ncbi:MAG: FAD-dependent monooxygenase, partial [Terriglobales bacterium]
MAFPFAKPWDVFVAGGGPAGLATAIAARRRGLSVIVADGALAPIDKPCGEGLLPDGVEALRDLGVEIPPGEAYPFGGVRFISGRTQAQAEFPRGTAYGMRRTHLHRVMVERAAGCGVRMLWQAAVTGLHPEGALVAGELVRACWVVGADGTGSRVRNWAKLDAHEHDARLNQHVRFAFRRHYGVAPWSDFMELHWGDSCQAYVTPIGREEVCVSLISFDPGQRLREEESLDEFPQLWAHIKNAEYTSSERGAITVTRRWRRVYRGRTVLV